MATTLTTKKNVEKNATESKSMVLTGEALIAFISGAQTNIGKSTFYNLKDEQRQAMIDQHAPVFTNARSFYSLMMLPTGVNDVNKQLIAWTLIDNSLPATETYIKNGLTHKYSAFSKWENELILQAFDKMPVTRVFDFLTMLQEKRVTKKRAMFLIHEYLRKNKNRWSLWAIKYRNEFKRILYHAHTNGDEQLLKIWRYLKYNEYENCSQLIKDYVAVQNGDKEKLAKLPATVAEGFMSKFKIKPEDFWKMYKDEGGQLTAKEKRLKVESVKAVGVDTGFDMRQAKLFDLLVYLNSLDKLPKPVNQIRELLENKAKEIAKNISFTLDDVGLILDTSKSMYGTNETKYHPMLRGLAISMVLKQVSTNFKEYRTNGNNDELFPTLKDQSNYADAFMQALKDGCKTIIIVGDGYENSPFEGALHQLIFALKKKVDVKNKVMIIHFNPVFAAESMDVRTISNIAATVGVREVNGLNESMFLAIAKHKPELAIAKFCKHLLTLQSDKAKELMPDQVREQLIESKGHFLESK